MNEEYYQMYLEELRQIKPCSDDERQILLGRALKGEESAKKRLIEGHLIFALALAKDFRDKGLSMSDLVQEANLALTLAVGEYQEGDFLAQAKEKISASLQEALKCQQQENQVEEAMAERVNRLQEVSARMAQELGREATVEELAQRMEMSSEEIREIMKLAVDALSVTGEFARTPAESLGEETFNG